MSVCVVLITCLKNAASHCITTSLLLFVFAPILHTKRSVCVSVSTKTEISLYMTFKLTEHKGHAAFHITRRSAEHSHAYQPHLICNLTLSDGTRWNCDPDSNRLVSTNPSTSLKSARICTDHEYKRRVLERPKELNSTSRQILLIISIHLE